VRAQTRRGGRDDEVRRSNNLADLAIAGVDHALGRLVDLLAGNDPDSRLKVLEKLNEFRAATAFFLLIPRFEGRGRRVGLDADRRPLRVRGHPERPAVCAEGPVPADPFDVGPAILATGSMPRGSPLVTQEEDAFVAAGESRSRVTPEAEFDRPRRR
jgi:hypothetical protein